MSRRRLRVVCSSDEDDDDFPPPPPPQQQQDEDIDDLIIGDIETDFQTVTLNSTNPTPSTNNSTTASTDNRHGSRHVEPISLDISDEGEESVIVNGPTTIPNSISDNANDGNSYFQVSEYPVHGVLEGLGLRLRREWLDSCLHGLQSAVQGFQRMDDTEKAKLCFAQFLSSDMNCCGAGVLPPNVNTLHLVDLKGPFVLQVDEIVNISNPLRGRYQNAAPGIKRCVKLSMTDGIQHVFGMEYRPIKDLEVLASAGLKVAICNVNIRHGLLMLVPEVIEILGGTVEQLEAARQRLVDEIRKPPQGKRSRTGVVPPLASRATLAAWPPCNNAVPGHADRNAQVNTIPLEASGQGSAVSFPANDMHRQNSATPFSRSNAETNAPTTSTPQEQYEVPRHTDIPAAGGRSIVSVMQPLERVTTPQHINEPSPEVMTPSGGTRQGIPANYMPGEDAEVPFSRDNTEANASSTHMDVEEISMMDELENNFILCGDKEIPFTYLFSLSTKCAANDVETSVRGKIKCFLTGVKWFRYKESTTFELRVYIDDGSLISEILIDHNLVQNGIGYSPQEVASAVASPGSKGASEIKRSLKQFQIFLANFEGTMIVEMSKASPVPVAVEMNQGCAASDAWLLLKRVKSSGSAPKLSHLNPIDLSP